MNIAQPAPAIDKLVCDKSSFLMYAEYDPKEMSLEVGYRNGKVVQHSPVYKQTWEDFKVAPSKGRFYNATIARITPGELVKA